MCLRPAGKGLWSGAMARSCAHQLPLLPGGPALQDLDEFSLVLILVSFSGHPSILDLSLRTSLSQWKLSKLNMIYTQVS